VGSLNADNRSIRLNDESALLMHDPRVAAALDSLFQSDLANARRITLATHLGRPLWTRFLERATRLVAPLL
jgi:cardiolipin synthase